MDAYFQKYPKRKPFRDAPSKFKELFDISWAAVLQLAGQQEQFGTDLEYN
jgi:hypothetical protein